MTYFSPNCSMKTSTTVLYFFSVSVMNFNAGGGPVQMREMPGDQVKLHLADDPAGEHGRYLGQRLGNLLPGKQVKVTKCLSVSQRRLSRICNTTCLYFDLDIDLA